MRSLIAMRSLTGVIDETVPPQVDGPVSRALVRGAWKEYGTCRQTDAELWFADSSHRLLARAASICSDCPVRRPCLTWALVFDERFGVWGGLTPTERRPLRRRLTRGEPVAALVTDALSSSSSRPESAAGGEVA